MPQHPFERLTPEARKGWFWALLALSLLMMALLNWVGAPLYTPAAPAGIVSFEVAGSLANAEAMLDSWDGPAKVQAGFLQGLDYLFLVVYSCAFALGCIEAASTLRRTGGFGPALARFGSLLAWGQWLAAGLDAVENAALVALLFGQRQAFLPPLAAVAAYGKFVLLGLGLAYLLSGALGRLLRRPQPTALGPRPRRD